MIFIRGAKQISTPLDKNSACQEDLHLILSSAWELPFNGYFLGHVEGDVASSGFSGQGEESGPRIVRPVTGIPEGEGWEKPTSIPA